MIGRAGGWCAILTLFSRALDPGNGGPIEHGCSLRASCSALFLEHVTICQLRFSVIIGNNEINSIL